MSDASDAGPGGVQSIARAARILRALEAVPEGLGIADLSASVELPKSTVHRIAGALAEEDLASVGTDGRWRLGGGLTRLGAATRRQLRHDLMPVLLQLRQQLDETVDLSVLDGAEARFVEQVAAPHRLRAVSAVGTAFPLHCTANGKALLSALPAEQVALLLPARLARETPRTLVTRAALAEDLAASRTRGYAVDHEEHTEGICAVGAVVHDGAGPVAALSVPVPTQRFAGHETGYGAAVRDAAARATTLLGGG